MKLLLENWNKFVNEVSKQTAKKMMSLDTHETLADLHKQVADAYEEQAKLSKTAEAEEGQEAVKGAPAEKEEAKEEAAMERLTGTQDDLQDRASGEREEIQRARDEKKAEIRPVGVAEVLKIWKKFLENNKDEK